MTKSLKQFLKEFEVRLVMDGYIKSDDGVWRKNSTITHLDGWEEAKAKLANLKQLRGYE